MREQALEEFAKLLADGAPAGLDVSVLDASPRSIRVIATRLSSKGTPCRSVVAFSLEWWERLNDTERLAWIARDIGEADRRIQALIGRKART